MATVLVLGGGISGLACAYYLVKFGRSSLKKVILIEKSSRLGGWIQSTKFPDGTIFEHGPKSVRPAMLSGYNTLALVDELFLGHEVIGIPRATPAGSMRYILHNNKLCSISTSPLSWFKRIPPFSKPLTWYLLSEPFRKPKLSEEDESFYSFINRRFGKEMAEYFSDPICRGTVAGDARKISVRSFMPHLYQMEKNHGSILKALLRKRKDPIKKSHHEEILSNEMVVKAREGRWAMWTLANGLQSLPDSMASKIRNASNAEVLTNTTIKKVHFTSPTLATVELEGGHKIEADHVFSCLKAPDLGAILSIPEMTQHLNSIDAVHVATVILEYPGNLLPVQGFGFLAPSCEGSQILGIVFDSCCFPEQNGRDMEKTRITVMMGGHWFGELFGNVDTVSRDKLLDVALKAAGQYLNIKIDPSAYMVCIHKNAIPQYTLGHHSRIANLTEHIRTKNLPLNLLGASFEGVSINDCIFQSRLAVESFLEKQVG